MRQILAFIVLGICLANPVVAATFDWSNTLGGHFSTATSWSPSGGPPSVNDIARFNLPNTYNVPLSGTTSLTGLLHTQGTLTLDLTSNATLQLSSQHPNGMGATNLTSTMNILGGNFLPGTFAVGSVPNSVANLYLGSGSNTTTSTASGFTVGQAGAGNLSLTQGSTLMTSSAVVGATRGGTGNATVAGATWIDTGTQLKVGDAGTGNLNISSGGNVLAQALTVGNSGSGAVSLQGAQSMLVVSGSTTIGGGIAPATLNVGSGANANLGNVTVGPNGMINITGGTVKITSYNGPGSLSGPAANWTGGTLIYDVPGAIPVVELTSLLGGGPTIRQFCTFASPSGTLSWSNSLVVAGALNVSGLTLNSGAILEVRDFGVLGAVGASSTLTNNTGAVLDLNSQFAQVNSAMTNSGVVRGTGTFTNGFTNADTGVIRVEAGDALQILNATPQSPASTNSGRIELAGGTIEFPPGFENKGLLPGPPLGTTGLITGRGVIRTGSFRGGGAGLVNKGNIALTAGTTDIYGDVTNFNLDSHIHAAGGATVIFYDDVVNQGFLMCAPGSRMVFAGSLSGLTGVVGGGDTDLIGDLDPGNSPADMSFGGNLQLGFTATLNIELAGTTKGAQYDSVTVGGIATLGGALNLQLIDGFVPQAGQSFSILNAAGGINGAFGNVQFPALAGGLYFDLARTPTSINVFVAGIPGDFNRNGIVDSADYTVWRNTRGQTGAALAADADNSGAIDQSDYNIWRAHFGERSTTGSASGASTSSVPETTSLTALVLGIGLLTLRRSPGLTKSRLRLLATQCATGHRNPERPCC